MVAAKHCGYELERLLTLLNQKPINEFKVETKLNLSEQRVIHSDVDRTRPKVLSDNERIQLETMLTFYCKELKITYKQGMNELMAPFLLMTRKGIALHEAYASFKKFIQITLPTMFIDNAFRPLHGLFLIFNLLFRYHEPDLCSFFQENTVYPECYATSWFVTAFASKIKNIETLSYLWESLVQESDVLFICYISIALLQRYKSKLLEEQGPSIAQVISKIKLESIEEIAYLIEKAQDLKRKMPFSLHMKLQNYNIYNLDTIDSVLAALNKEYCLSVLPREVMQNCYPGQKFCTCIDEKCSWCTSQVPEIPIVLIDCRPDSEQRHGRFPNSILLDKRAYNDENIMINIPDSFNELKGVFHIFLLGNKEFRASDFSLRKNSDEEDPVQNMLENLLQLFIIKGFPYVSLVEGGFQKCHEFAMHYKLNIENHQNASCDVCNPNVSCSSIESKLRKLKDVIHGKVRAFTTVVKDIGKSISPTEPAKKLSDSEKYLSDPSAKFYLCKKYDEESNCVIQSSMSLIITETEIAIGQIRNNRKRSITQVIDSKKISSLQKFTTKLNPNTMLNFYFGKSSKPICIILKSTREVHECSSLISKYYKSNKEW
ncbi:TBC1D23_5 [Blepharisma stoltei]|uniref:Rab-GAP TBC domain-containing protein n=1 Tax=Blepharisma stoltei TaxID=1481888 RepID=A0AAU9IJU6_9CILI|nr:unnamed protein product [Blepharisma stoltei]